MKTDDSLRTASKLAQAGKTSEAIDCLESTLDLTRSAEDRPANTSNLARMAGVLCMEAGKLSQAAAYYEEAVATKEGDPLTLLALADVRWRLGEVESARLHLAKAESVARAASDSDVLKMVAKIRAEWATGSGPRRA
jgi:tetratricopeptide (TPR) repeat protein